MPPSAPGRRTEDVIGNDGYRVKTQATTNTNLHHRMHLKLIGRKSQTVGRQPEGQEGRQERRKYTKQQIMTESEKEQKETTANKTSLALTSANTTQFYRKQRYVNDAGRALIITRPDLG
jgi:hypothetical protein